jgi:propanol-preferring alcohol dehydrogenase
VIGSIVGSRADLAEVFRLHIAGRTKVLYEARPLETINESISDVLASRVPARLVLLP